MSKPPLPRTVSRPQQATYLPRRPAQQPQSRAAYKGRSVGTFVPKITQKVFEKFGFSTATLLTDWAVIIGRELAAVTAPERLKWPRGIEGAGEGGEEPAGRPGATLVLRVEPSRALDIQYKTRLLIDRINAYFGYRAVAEIRLIQAPLLRTAVLAAKAPAMAPVASPNAAVAAIADDGLRLALIALEASIRADAAEPRGRRSTA